MSKINIGEHTSGAVRQFGHHKSSAKTIFYIIITILSWVPSAMAQTKHIDGFTVSILNIPTKDIFPLPTAITGDVRYLLGTTPNKTRTIGFDPFYNIPSLQNISPYLSFGYDGTVSFSYSSPKTVFTLLWGTPDDVNLISFYDQNNHLIGTLVGADFQTAYGFSNFSRPFPTGYEDTTRIVSPVAFEKVVLSNSGTSTCCFEFANVSAR